jgi:hypothetical protein
VLDAGPAHHVDTEAERALIINAGGRPVARDASEHSVRVHAHRVGAPAAHDAQRRASGLDDVAVWPCQGAGRPREGWIVL